MASRTTYLLLSGVPDLDAVHNHSVVDEYELEHSRTFDATDNQHPAIRFAFEHPLEDDVDLEPPARQLSEAFPDATVVLCEVEERFDHVEYLQTIVYLDGKRAGEIEHGYVFNVGAR